MNTVFLEIQWFQVTNHKRTLRLVTLFCVVHRSCAEHVDQVDPHPEVVTSIPRHLHETLGVDAAWPTPGIASKFASWSRNFKSCS